MNVLETLTFSVGLVLYISFWLAVIAVPIHLNIEHNWSATKTIPALLVIFTAFIFVTALIGNHFFA